MWSNPTAGKTGRRWGPGKLLLMLSGCVFILMTAPAWIPGFCAALAACLLWCLAAWRLLEESAVRNQREPVCWAAGLLLCAGFGCNFYNTWADSSYMLKIARLLHIPAERFVFGAAVLLTLLAVPAVGSVLSCFVMTAVRDYREMRSREAAETGIPFGKALLILFVVYGIGISAILRTNFYYQDDVSRAVYGYKQWDYFGRYLSTALSTLVHMGDYLTDIAPLPQLLAMLILAFSGVVLLYIVCGRTRFTLWELAAVVPLGLNPYFLECISFRFDAPYMAVSVLAGILPLLYRKRSTIVYFFASMLSILAVCTSYQSATGVFPMLVILLALREWNRGESFFPFCLKSVAGYGAGLVYFKLVIMKPADAGYVSNALPELSELIPHTLENLKQYYSLILSDFKPYWLALTVLLAVGFLWGSVTLSRRKKAASAAMALAALALMCLLCFGIYPVLADTLFAPRAMYGFGVLIVLLGITAVEGKGISRKLPVAVLSWAFFVFSFTYGNALNLQKEYTDFRIGLVIQDLNDMELFQSGEDITVQISGGIGKAPVLSNMPRDYEILNRLIPETFSGSSDLARSQFFHYYGLKNVIQDSSIDLTERDLPVLEEHMYHTIRGEGNQVLIELKE